MEMKTVKFGDRVRVQYAGLRKDGIPIKRRPAERVLEFTAGSDEVIPGISRGVVGMTEGQQKRLTLQPQDAFGTVRPHLIKEIPRERFPADLDLCLGKRLTAIGVTSRRHRRVRVVEIKPETVVVDGNHPLANRVLEVQVQLLSLDSSSADFGAVQYDAGGEA